ncbi:MAG: hypothetical protein LBN25_05230 [Christensenellaceae bacterium]|jgi:ABC-2 type transport system permease protein|nr:hypothetical protein [Christensenellaceae bacterium]
MNVYKSLTAILLQNGIGGIFSSKKKKEKAKQLSLSDSAAKARQQKLIGRVVMAIALVIIEGYVAIMTLNIALPLGISGRFELLFYTVIAMTEFVALFFGGGSLISYLYGSDDANLLLPLPIKPHIIYLAKLTAAYIIELVISALIMLPTLITACIVGGIGGYGVEPFTFILSLIVLIFIVPAVPLILISIITAPLMLLTSVFKKKGVIQAVTSAVLGLGIVAMSFAMSFLSSAASYEEDSDILTADSIAIFDTFKKAMPFNAPFVSVFTGEGQGYALIGGSQAVNSIVHLLLVIAIFAVLLGIGVFVMAKFYGKVLPNTSEGGGAKTRTKKAKTPENPFGITAYKDEAAPFKVTLFKKEFTTLFAQPMLLANVIISLILPPVMILVMSRSLGLSFGEEDDIIDIKMIMTGFICYIAFIMQYSTNIQASCGFSREGKQLFTILTLPVSQKEIVNAKVLSCFALSAPSLVIMSVIFPVMFKISNPIAVFGFPLCLIVTTIAGVCSLLVNDLKHPNLTWTNIAEMTKNNTRTLKTVMFGIVAGFAILILGVMLAFAHLNEYLSYALLFGSWLLALSIKAVIAYKTLNEKGEELLAGIAEA